MTLRQKLIGTQALAVIAVLLGMSFYYQYSSLAAERELADKLTATADLLAQNTAAAVVFLDPETASEMLASLRVEQHVMNASIYNEAGEVFASYQREDVTEFSFPAVQTSGTTLTEDQFELFHPLTSGGVSVGTVYLRSNLTWLETRRRELLQQTVILLCLGGGISTLLLLLLQRSIAGPLRRLSEASARVAESSEHTQVEGGGTDELEALATAFNQMVSQVQARDRSLREARDTLEQRVEERTTELRQATEAVQKELDGRLAAEERIQALVDSAAAGMLVVDGQGRMALVNDYFVSMFGYERDELIGQPAVMLVPDAAREIHEGELHDFLDDPDDPGQGRLRSLHGRRKDGSELPLEIGIAPMVTQEGTFVSMVVIDVTDRKRAMEELNAARDLAERTNAAKSAFMANISHELRTPLNGIIGAGEILQHGSFGQLSPQQHEYVGTVLESGQQLLKLINNIVDVARMESGELALAPGAVDLKRVLGELEESFGVRAAEKGLAFNIDLDGEVPQAIVIDGHRLRQVLGSLIDNGIKFTKRGSVLLQVKSSTAAEIGQCNLTFCVRDTGPGIPDDQQQGIFEAFGQREGQSINEYGGVGVGLALTRRIVDSMGGTIHLQSVLGVGSTFEVVLTEVPTASLEEIAEEVPHVDADRVTFHAAKVLVADDVHTNRHLIRGFLETYGLAVVEADNGAEAIDAVRRESPDLVLMDVKMPVLDGFKATERLKANEATRELPVIALTASVMRESETEIRELFDGFLRKPVGRDHLVEELARFLSNEDAAAGEEFGAGAEGPVWSPDTLDDAMRARLPELQEVVDGELQTEWEEANHTQILNNVEALGERAGELGREYGFEPLRDWGERLQVQASTFQMDAMPKTLEEFPGMVLQLRAAVEGA